MNFQGIKISVDKDGDLVISLPNQNTTYINLAGKTGFLPFKINLVSIDQVEGGLKMSGKSGRSFIMNQKRISELINFVKDSSKDEMTIYLKGEGPLGSDVEIKAKKSKKKIMENKSNLKEFYINRLIKKVLNEEQDVENYMFFSNLEQIKKQCEKLLSMDKQMIDQIIKNGHDWADDHVSEAKNNMDQVFDFLMGETSKSEDYIDFEDIHEGRKKTGTKLCARGKAAAKAKFKVYPSAYANGYAVQVCKGKMPGTDGKKRCSAPYC